MRTLSVPPTASAADAEAKVAAAWELVTAALEDAGITGSDAEERIAVLLEWEATAADSDSPGGRLAVAAYLRAMARVPHEIGRPRPRWEPPVSEPPRRPAPRDERPERDVQGELYRELY